MGLKFLKGGKQCRIRRMSRITFQYLGNNDVNIGKVLRVGSRVLFASVRFRVNGLYIYLYIYI